MNPAVPVSRTFIFPATSRLFATPIWSLVRHAMWQISVGAYI
jgi:hypothetical protein